MWRHVGLRQVQFRLLRRNPELEILHHLAVFHPPNMLS